MSSKLLRSGAIVSLMTLVSRVLGLVRDVVLAALLGTSASADVYYFAAKIPNFMRRLFAEGPLPRPLCRCSARCRPRAPRRRCGH